MKLGESRNIPDKLIDSWTYKVKDVQTDEEAEAEAAAEAEQGGSGVTKKRTVNRVITVKVYLVKQTRGSEEPPHPLESVSLVLRCEELGLKIEGTDLAAMKAAAWAELDSKFAIKWEHFFLVSVQKASIYSGEGAALSVSYDDVYKGTTVQGEHLLRRRMERFYRIEVWPGAFKDANGKVTACIPATEENERALREFARRVDALREMMAEFLRPDVIQENLSRFGGL